METDRLKLRFESLFDGTRTLQDCIVDIDRGRIVQIGQADGDSPIDVIRGVAVPGMPNTHSHAFQRAMVGLAEWRGSARDSFWSWRKTMYDLAGRMTPQLMGAVAAQLYMELLEGGFTQVVEFNYLHHDADGTPYGERDIMHKSLLRAAGQSRIGITLAPVLYQSGGFGNQPLSGGQLRFYNSTTDYLGILKSLGGVVRENQRIAVAFHSLRAVDLSTIKRVIDCVSATCPVHIHIAEQPLEVDDCVRHLGARPVCALMDAVDVNRRWSLVHATHVDTTEVERVAASGASVGLCPMTEANLGDGVFPLVDFAALNGQFTIGTDSHVETTVAAELRMLEYGQRLTRLRRCQLATEAQPDVAAALWGHCARSAAPVVGDQCGQIVPGAVADIVVLDSEVFRDGKMLARHVFGDRSVHVREVYAAGQKVVENGRHRSRDAIEEQYGRALAALSQRTGYKPS